MRQSEIRDEKESLKFSKLFTPFLITTFAVFTILVILFVLPFGMLKKF